MDITNETPAPTGDDIGRVYLNGQTRVMLVNDRLVADKTLGDDCEVTIKQVEPDDLGQYPVTLVDYRDLTATDERIHPTVAASYEVKPPNSFDKVADGVYAALRRQFGAAAEAHETFRDSGGRSNFEFDVDGATYSLVVTKAAR